MNHLKDTRWLATMFAVAALSPFAADTVRADEVTDWHEHMISALNTANATSAVVTSRDAALVSTSVFDAVNGIERRYQPIHIIATAPRGASKRAAAVQAAYTILINRYPAQASDLNAKRTASLAAITDNAENESVMRGLEWGQFVASAVLAWRSTDGFSPAPPPYLGSSAIGKWRPTPTAFAPGVGPQFASMPPWGILSPDQFLPTGPPSLDSAQYLADFNETKVMGSVSSPFRNTDQTDACRFWASSGPIQFWDRAAIELAVARGFELSDNSRLMAMLNLAIADATIACWNAKYRYEFWRPVTAIPLADLDGVDATIGDPAWTPLIATPAHPEYPSGHSSNAGAAAAVLASYFGADVSFTLKTPAMAGWERHFSNVAASLDEVADARVFAGIHFRTACNEGVALGQSVGAYLLANKMQRLHGEGE